MGTKVTDWGTEYDPTNKGFKGVPSISSISGMSKTGLYRFNSKTGLYEYSPTATWRKQSKDQEFDFSTHNQMATAYANQYALQQQIKAQQAAAVAPAPAPVPAPDPVVPPTPEVQPTPTKVEAPVKTPEPVTPVQPVTPAVQNPVITNSTDGVTPNEDYAAPQPVFQPEVPGTTPEQQPVDEPRRTPAYYNSLGTPFDLNASAIRVGGTEALETEIEGEAATNKRRRNQWSVSSVLGF